MEKPAQTQTNHYIYDLSSELTIDLAGLEAESYRKMLSTQIGIPPGFVISSGAFDDFLQYNNLTGPISKLLFEIGEVDEKKIRKYAAEIQKLISSANLSLEFQKELTDYYKKLAGIGNSLVYLEMSSLSETLQKSVSGSEVRIKEVYGIDELMVAVKAMWASLFSFEALAFREKIRYEGVLSSAVLVFKDPVAEISMLVNYGNTMRAEADLEIEAVLGSIEPLLQGKMIGDSYAYSMEKSALVEKTVMEQKWMYVQRFNKGRLKKDKVDISAAWRVKQKLSEAQINKVAQIVMALNKDYKTPFKVTMVVELGKIVLLDVEEQEVPQIIEERSSNLSQLRKVLESPSVVSELSTPKQPEIPVFEDKVEIVTQKKSINEYVDEVNTIVEKAQLQPAPDDDELAEETNMEVEVGENAKPRVEPFDSIPTATQVYAIDFNKPLYQGISKNLDGIIALSGDEFMSQKDVQIEDAIRSPGSLIESLINYIKQVLDQTGSKPVIYKFASEVYRTDLNASFGLARITAGESIIEAELAAIHALRNKLNYKNLWVAIPFIRDDNEFLEIKKMIAVAKLRRSPSFKIMAVIENAVSAAIIEDLVESGVDAFLYDLDSLSRHTLGFAIPGRSIEKGLTKLIKQSLKEAGKNKVQTTIYGSVIGNGLDLKEALDLGVSGVGVKMTNVMTIKNTLKDLEVGKLKKASKPKRK